MLSSGFRHQDLGSRRREAADVFGIPPEEWDAVSATPGLLELADVMVEQAVGCVPLPLGIATGFLIDGRETAVPMAVEEPSVIAAATLGAHLTRRDGGFVTSATEPLMTAQVFLEGVGTAGESALRRAEAAVRDAVAPRLASLTGRGGGWRGLTVGRLDETGLVRVDIVLDVRDAMGANILNTTAETARPVLERIGGGKALMCILTNASVGRTAGARFAIPVSRLAGRLPEGMTTADAARRIALASMVAREDAARAVTHNKGIMNGISSLALATMNDTRAIEAAAHAWAARDGHYRGLSVFAVQGDTLVGELELPLPFATVGGAIDLHPVAQACLRVLGRPDSPGLARIAAALGLAQNFAALLALTTHGIQRGHMRQHAARLAWRAGARGADVRKLADALADAGAIDMEHARALLRGLRGEPRR